MTAYPIKPSAVKHDILSEIQHRWSPVIFDPRPVEEEKIAQMFEAARWAPSSFNEQPWRYIYTQKSDDGHREKLESLLADGNAWAKDAGVLLIVFSCGVFIHNDKVNDNAEYDTGCATGYLFLQLKSLGLIGHEMAGFSKENANALLGVPDVYKPVAMMAVGYPGNPDKADDDLLARDKGPRTRKEIHEFAFHREWQESPAA